MEVAIGIDLRIKPILMNFWKAGFSTHGSCEGHFDHGLNYPWINFVDKASRFELLIDCFNKKSDIKIKVEDWGWECDGCRLYIDSESNLFSKRIALLKFSRIVFGNNNYVLR